MKDEQGTLSRNCSENALVKRKDYFFLDRSKWFAEAPELPEERYGMQKMKIGHQHTGSNPRTHPSSKKVPAEIGSMLEVTWIDKQKRKQKDHGRFLCVTQTGKEQSLILVQRVTDEIIPTSCVCIPKNRIRKFKPLGFKKDKTVKWRGVQSVFNYMWKMISRAWRADVLELNNIGYGETRANKTVADYFLFNVDKDKTALIGDLERAEWSKIPRLMSESKYNAYMKLKEKLLWKYGKAPARVWFYLFKNGPQVFRDIQQGCNLGRSRLYDALSDLEIDGLIMRETKQMRWVAIGF